MRTPVLYVSISFSYHETPVSLCGTGLSPQGLQVQQIWKRLPDEVAVWYARFEAYRLIGPARSIDECYRRVSGLHRLSGARPGQAWYKAAEKWEWQVRAEAWDEAERERLMSIEHRRRFDARQERLRTISEMMAMVQGVIATADPASLSVAEAREMLPMMRLMLRDMMAAQRVELGLPLVDSGGSDVLPFSADELAKARRELAADGHGAGPVAMLTPMMAWMPSRAAANGFTSALTDALARLYPDEVSARRVAVGAGVDVARVRFGSAINTWHQIVEEAQYMGTLDDLVAMVGGEYGASPELLSALEKGKSYGNS